MYKPDELGLCCGSLVQADFRGLAEAAASAGFRTISVWPTLFDAALESGLSEQDLRNILADNQLSITELDPMCSWLPIDPADAGLASTFAAYSADDFFRIADTLGATTLNVVQATDDPFTKQEITDHLATLCERARTHDLTVTIEFLPWSPIGNLQTALDLVSATGQSNCGVNIDTWHHFRSGGTIEQLTNLDSTLIGAMQFNDVGAEPWDDIYEETAVARLLPGQGSSDSVAVIKALWQSGVRVPLSVEVFNMELMGLPANKAAGRIGDAMRAVLAGASR